MITPTPAERGYLMSYKKHRGHYWRANLIRAFNEGRLSSSWPELVSIVGQIIQEAKTHKRILAALEIAATPLE